MIIGDILLDVLIFTFTIIFLYYNIVAQNNFLNSYVIILEDPDPVCEGNAANLPSVSINSLKACEKEEQRYIYQDQENSLIFIVSTAPEDAGNFSSVCNAYCPPEILSQFPTGCGDPRLSVVSIPYENCIKLLDPDSDCANSSSPLAYDAGENKYLWAVRGTLEPTC